jgi:hypothetical protein
MKNIISVILGILLFTFMSCSSERKKSDSDNMPVVSQAQKNALKRIAQLTEIKWQPLMPGVMPSRKGFFSGELQTGVPYSSARGVGRWIGYDISLETFMTALQNPESVLYTENLREEPYNVPNAATYYGLTCSSFAQYAFRDDYYLGTLRVHENPADANMKLIEDQSSDGIELCDLLNTEGKGHMEIITGITYSEGVVDSVEVTEIVHAGPRRKKYSAPEFNRYIKDRSYFLYRYNFPDEIPYIPSKYVAVGNEVPQVIKYNTVLALDRGNKTNYVQDTPVKFNIMDSNATRLIIKKDNTIIDNIDIIKTGVIEKIYSDCGKYTAYCLMKDESKSDEVEFIVSRVLVSVQATAKVGSEIEISFSSEMCVPRYVFLEEAGKYNAILSRTFTQEEIINGSVTISYGKAGLYTIVVNGLNEFGGVYSGRKTINIIE